MLQPSSDPLDLATRLLIVDDDAGLRELTAQFLEQHGYVVDTAAGGAEMRAALAMPAAACAAVYSGAASTYTNSTSNFSRVSIANDNVFGDNSAAQVAQQTPTLTGSVAAGYTGRVTIGLAR